MGADACAILRCFYRRRIAQARRSHRQGRLRDAWLPPGRGCLRHFAPLPLLELVHCVGRAERELDDCANRTRNRCVHLECDSVTPPRPRSHSRPPRPSRPRPSRSRPRRKRLVFLNTRHEQDFSAREVASLSGNRFERRLVVLGERVDRRSGTGAPPSRPVEGRAPARACRSSPPRSSLSFVSTLTVTFALVAAPCHRHAGALAPQVRKTGRLPTSGRWAATSSSRTRARATDRPTDRPTARPPAHATARGRVVRDGVSRRPPL